MFSEAKGKVSDFLFFQAKVQTTIIFYDAKTDVNNELIITIFANKN